MLSRKKIFAVLMVIAVSLPLMSTGQGETASEGDLETIRVGTMPYKMGLPLKLIEENGWDVENGFEIERSVFVDGASMNEALGAGQIDIGTFGGAGIFGVARYDAKIVGAIEDSAWSHNIYARADNAIVGTKGTNSEYPEIYGNPETVRGKTILVPVGTIGHLEVLRWLNIIGVEQSEIELINMSPQKAFSAFQAGRGDFVYSWSPVTFNAPQDWQIVFTAIDSNLRAPEFLVANKRAYDEKPEVLVTFMTQFYRGVKQLKEDHEFQFTELKEWYEGHGSTFEDKWVRREIEGRPWFTLQQNAEELYPQDKLRDWLDVLTSFFVEQEKLEPELKEKVLNNVVSDLVDKAYEKTQ